MSATATAQALTHESIASALAKAQAELRLVRAAMAAPQRDLAAAYVSGAKVEDKTIAIMDRCIRIEQTIAGLKQLSARLEYTQQRAIVDAWNEERPGVDARLEAARRAELDACSPGVRGREFNVGNAVIGAGERAARHAVEVLQCELRDGDRTAQKAERRCDELLEAHPIAFDSGV
jgi:hypothetical protein